MIRRAAFLLVTFIMCACSSGGPSGGDPDSLDVVPDAPFTDGLSAELETVENVCGDEFCDPDKETCDTCPADCGICEPVCPNQLCEDGEACDTCPEDCGECTPECGDSACDEGETCDTCPVDCGNCCGDGTCDGALDPPEDCDTCPADCGECEPVCDDGACDEGEDCDSCPADCGPCEAVCPNDACEEGEDCDSCPDDCGTCECGDGTCNGDEDCDSCPDDCTECNPVCGDGVVTPELDEECDDGNTDPDDGCDEECKIEPQVVDAGAILITEIMKNPTVDDGVGEWFEIYNTTDVDIDLNGWMLTDDGIDSHKIFDYDGVLVPAKSYFVLGRSADDGINGGVPVDYVYANFNLSNKDDEVVLTVWELEIDRVNYDNGATFPNVEGAALSLSPDAYDAGANDAGAAWCSSPATYGDGDFGSPGQANPDCEVAPECGDDACDDSEDCATCPDDCGNCCGNAVCQGDLGEDCATCEADCGPCPAACDDGTCDPDENCDNCPEDCGSCCGNGACDANFGETCQSCSQDCGQCCGNDSCDEGFGETCQSCPQDCGNCCGNGKCEGNLAESCTTCPDDCGACPYCGDGDCNGGETCSTCTQDCGTCPPECGDGECNGTETCSSCVQDCGQCPGQGWCQLSGTQGQEISCAINLAAENNTSPKATQFQFDFSFDAAKVAFDGTNCPQEFMGMCFTNSGHQIESAQQSAGVYRVTLTKTGEPVPLTQAWLSGQSVVGAPYVVDLTFSLKKTISAGQAVQVELSNMTGADATASAVSASQQEDGLIVTSAQPVQAVCGDGDCNGTETCSNCPSDCGTCPPVCGDGDCNGTETCDSCSQDCGECPSEGWGLLSGSQGATVAVPIDLAAQSASSPKATQFQFDVSFDAAKVTFEGPTCPQEFMGMCFTNSGHQIEAAQQSAGKYRVTLTKTGTPAAITNAYLSGQSVAGQPHILDLEFTLKTTISAGQAVQVSLSQMTGSDSTASALSATQQADGLIVTSAQ